MDRGNDSTLTAPRSENARIGLFIALHVGNISRERRDFEWRWIK
jgi:hypothetical protein